MEPDKAPGPDGFTTRFIKVCWKIIKNDLHRMIQKSQSCSKIGGSTNSAFLALIPKEKGAKSFDRFRPISLCNIGYKIITKVMANGSKTYCLQSFLKIKGASSREGTLEIILFLSRRPFIQANLGKKKVW
jgi:hypothetical protein